MERSNQINRHKLVKMCPLVLRVTPSVTNKVGTHALIVELVNRCPQKCGHYQSLTKRTWRGCICKNKEMRVAVSLEVTQFQ